MSEAARTPVSDERERNWHESALRSAALAGDQVAWQTLFDATYDAVYRKLHSHAGPLTEEVIQESWIIAARRLVDFDPRRRSGMFEPLRFRLEHGFQSISRLRSRKIGPQAMRLGLKENVESSRRTSRVL